MVGTAALTVVLKITGTLHRRRWFWTPESVEDRNFFKYSATGEQYSVFAHRCECACVCMCVCVHVCVCIPFGWVSLCSFVWESSMTRPYSWNPPLIFQESSTNNQMSLETDTLILQWKSHCLIKVLWEYSIVPSTPGLEGQTDVHLHLGPTVYQVCYLGRVI